MQVLLFVLFSYVSNGASFIGPGFDKSPDSTGKLSLVEKLLQDDGIDGMHSGNGWPPIWDVPNQSDMIHGIIVMLEANTRVNDVPLSPGDYVGGFYTDDYGELRCGGADFLLDTANIIFPLFMDDPATPEKDGFSFGETIYFKLFSWTTTKDYDVDVIAFDTSGQYTATDKWYPLGLSQIIDLQALEDIDFYIIAEDNPICIGDQLYLSAEEFIGAGGPYTFDWYSEPPGFTSNLQVPPPITPDETTTYFLTAGDGLFVSEHQLTVIVNELPQAFAGDDGWVCCNGLFSLNGTALNYENILWASSGDGVFDDPVSLNTFYSPGNQDILNGQATITLIAHPLNPCIASATDELLLQVLLLPQKIFLNCENYDFGNEEWLPIPLDFEIGTYTSLEWATTGDGYFDDTTSMPTNYNLGINDISNGEVTIFLEVDVQGTINTYEIIIYVPRQLIQIDGAGERGISSFLDLSMMSMPGVLGPISENLEIVINKYGQYYWPAPGINQIGNWSSVGYRADFISGCCLPLYGEMLEDRTFEVSGPFVYLPVLSDFPVEISSLLSGHFDDINHIFDWETEGYWTPDSADFTYLDPGKAYRLVTNGSNVNFTIEFPLENPACNPWTITPTPLVHQIAIPLSANLSIDGAPVNEGDWIGVFYVDDFGGLACGGATQWTDTTNVGVFAYGDDNTTPEKDGFANGEQIQWKIFNCSEAEEYIAFATYDPALPNHDGLFSPFGLSSLLSLETVFCQPISFVDGWNGVSLYLEPDDPTVENIFSPYPDDFIIMQNLTSVYWPSIPINTIGNWDIMSGYAIKFSSNQDIGFCGDKLTSRTVTLLPGWHYLPVLSECPVPTSEIFDPFINDIVLIKDLIGTEVYWPGAGVYTLQELMPGSAYTIKTSAEITITFPECARQVSTNLKTGSKLNSVWGEVQLMPNTHIISIPKEIAADFSSSDQIGVFGADGNCFGFLEFSNSGVPSVIILNGDDLSTIEKDGFTENEPLGFRLWDAETGEVSLMDVTFGRSMPNTELVFNNHGLSAITELKYSATGTSGLYDDMDVQIIPNPAKDVFMLSLGHENFNEGKLTIYKLDGQKAGVEKIFGRNTKINIGNLAPGIYILNLIIDGNVFNKRLVKH